MGVVETLVVNLFAGPGAGKSTLASGLFYNLKSNGVSTELVTEYIKGRVWEGAPIDDQLYIMAKQAHAIKRLIGKVSVVITDSPVLLSLVYAKDEYPHLKEIALHEHERTPNLNFLVGRVKSYVQAGRLNKIRILLDDLNIPYGTVRGNDEGMKVALAIVLNRTLQNQPEKDRHCRHQDRVR